MAPERWKQVEQLYYAALAQEPGRRSAFLTNATGGDEELRSEVESLLAHGGSVDGPLDRPAWAAAPNHVFAGAQLGPYRIEAFLGAGGTGDVYAGRDTRLDRPVAIKVLSEEHSHRFASEARAIAALNHPHICTLYDVGPGYLVMELLEGETLAARLHKGRLPMELLVRYGAQVLEALAVAHSKGVVHRDLKPGNLMVTRSGIKVLDFGLARMTHADQTRTGDQPIQGTPAYMAPEQWEGKSCDARTDIFSLGLVLYEMAAGKRLKPGDTAALRALPEPFAHLIARCVEPEPDNRWQSARDLKAELEWAGKKPGTGQGQKARVFLATFAALVLLAACFAAWLRFESAAPTLNHALRLTLKAPAGTRLLSRDLGNLEAGAATISPDGRLLAIVATQEDGSSLWVRRLDSQEMKHLDGTNGAHNTFWSPDSTQIAFFADQKLKKVPASGGAVEIICDAPTGRGGTWNRDGVIVFSPQIGSALHRVAASGGVPQAITQLDSVRQEDAHYWPQFLPDGKRVLYLARSEDPRKSAIRVAGLDLAFGSRIIAPSSVKALFSQGYLLMVRDSLLVAQPFDPDRLALSGEPRPLTTGVSFNGSYGPAAFHASENGILTYATSPASRLVWVNRQGQEVERLGSPGDYRAVLLGPDGKRAAVQFLDPLTGIHRVLLLDFVRGSRASFTQRTTNVVFPAWSRNGEVIVYISDRPAPANLYRKEVASDGPEVRLLPSGPPRYPNDWSPDGAYLIYQEGAPVISKAALWLLPFPEGPTGPPGPPVRFLGAGYHTAEARISPDGRHVAYVSAQSGVKEISVQTFPTPSKRIPVSEGGGTQPRWRRDGGELFYVGPKGTLIAVPITRNGAAIEPGKARPLFRHEGLSMDGFMDYDVAPDGLRFLMIAGIGVDTADDINVVVNWPLALQAGR